jgi:hypothetical protein
MLTSGTATRIGGFPLAVIRIPAFSTDISVGPFLVGNDLQTGILRTEQGNVDGIERYFHKLFLQNYKF